MEVYGFHPAILECLGLPCRALHLAPAFSIAEDIRHAFPEEAGSRSTVYFLTSSIVEGSRASVSFATFGLS